MSIAMLELPKNTFIVKFPAGSYREHIISKDPTKGVWEVNDIELLNRLQFERTDLGKILTESEVIEKYQQGGIEEVLKLFDFKRKPFKGNKTKFKTAIEEKIKEIKSNSEW